MNAIRYRTDPFWQGREAYVGAKGSDVPTFWVHGFFDANTKPEHLDIWSSLTGPKKAWFGQWEHIRGHEAGRVGAHLHADVDVVQRRPTWRTEDASRQVAAGDGQSHGHRGP